MEIILTVSEDTNIEPNRCVYTGGFVEILRCNDCGATSMLGDQYMSDPCRDCGGHVSTIGSGKWNNDKEKWMIRKWK